MENCGTSCPASSAARLRPDWLPEMVGIGELPRPDADRVQPRQQIQGREFADRMRQGIDADAERLHLGGGLQHLTGDALADAASGEGQAADAAACDHDAHD